MPVINGPAIMSEHPWDQARKLTLMRGYESEEITYPVSKMEPGVNFFILALEELGAKTRFSCEGHPCGFYIAFEGSYELAIELHDTRTFSVEVWKHNVWTLRNAYQEAAANGGYTEENRKQRLRWATEAWLRYFGPRLAKTKQQLAIARLANQIVV